MELSSSSFVNGGRIPIKHVMPGAGGQNVSLGLSWTDAPPGTKSFALSMVDMLPMAAEWVHWLVVNIPASVSSIPEGVSGKGMPQGSYELANSFGGMGYGGPQPPKGSGDHPYVITLYALNTDKLPGHFHTSLTDFKKSLVKKVLDKATLTGKYDR